VVNAYGSQHLFLNSRPTHLKKVPLATPFLKWLLSFLRAMPDCYNPNYFGLDDVEKPMGCDDNIPEWKI